MAQQLGEAMGVQRISRLVYELRDLGELKEGKHFGTVTGLNSEGPGNPRKLILSYRGVIRVAMRSQGQRAREFRDWAEEVLFQVMMTGAYGINRQEYVHISQVREWQEKLIELEIRDAVDRSTKLDWQSYRKLQRYRKMGLTQMETAKLLDLNKDTVKKFERIVRKYTLHFTPTLSQGELHLVEGGAL